MSKHRCSDPQAATREKAADERELHELSARMLDRAREFPLSALSPGDLTRREFVTLLGASVALAGLGACVREPAEKILPYVNGQPDEVPGVALHFATSMVLDGYATGLLVTSHDGRPTKIEGNPDHPASLGAAGIFEQASVLQLYDPHRARYVQAGRRRSSWRALAAAFSPTALGNRVGARGAGLRLLLEPTSSPLVIAMLARVQAKYPDSRTYFYSPLSNAGVSSGAESIFSSSVIPQHDFRNADVVVSLGSNFCASGPFNLRYARHFGARRRVLSPASRLYVAECAPTPTGTLADRRISASPTAMGNIAAALLATVAGNGHPGATVPAGTVRASAASIALTPAAREWVESAATDLIARRGRAIVIAGEHQAPEVQGIAHALNAALGNSGSATSPVSYSASPIAGAGETGHDLATFVTDLSAGGVDTLLVLEGNPVYTAPADLNLARAVGNVRNSLYLGMYDDEAARATSWLAPAAHYLESWGDARAYDGTVSMIQPLIAPMYDGHTPAEVLAMVAGEASQNGHDMLRNTWKASKSGGAAFESWWNDSVARGTAVGTALPAVTPSIRWDAVGAAHAKLSAPAGREQIEIRFVASPAVYDGRFADNGWLQELPHPITKLTWDNALMIGPAYAEQAKLATGDEVQVGLRGRALTVPVVIVPGHANDAVTLAMGYGRSGAEAVARGVGSNANVIRTWSAPYNDVGVTLKPTGAHRTLAITQEHWSLEGRGESIIGIAVAGSAAQHVAPPTIPPKKRRPLTLYEPAAPSPDGFGADQWAMVIDLNTCTGCGACVVACQAENNIPVVGRDSVLKSREMHWMRIDRYIQGSPDEPVVTVQPMLCQQCEKAPCEYVCPVDATVHSDDGLNEMVYNRCVGTRFCSNNCPYKVRRFNWFDYNGEIAETERMVKNPEVTVRARGVMEKCTFCIQRIRHAQIEAELVDKPTGPVVTACQQTCPTGAIIFGSLTNPASEVVRQREDPRCFSALDELGTVPRVRYLARTPQGKLADNGAPGDRSNG
jgi:molybdopterin-containing oxidoreductase family iron-sulfur binding subunit